MLMRCKQVSHKVLRGSSGGATLVEVAIAIVVLAILVGSVPAALLAISNAHFRANEIRVAENLTRNEFEYVKSQDYIWGNITYPVQYEVLPGIDGFGLKVMPAQPINAVTGLPYTPYLDPEDDVVKSQDDGIQLITVEVYGFGKRYGESGSKPLLVSTDYKVDR
jgi:type II secretory pathway pseudopilin PulG